MYQRIKYGFTVSLCKTVLEYERIPPVAGEKLKDWRNMHMLTVQCEDETPQLKLINCEFCHRELIWRRKLSIMSSRPVLILMGICQESLIKFFYQQVTSQDLWLILLEIGVETTAWELLQNSKVIPCRLFPAMKRTNYKSMYLQNVGIQQQAYADQHKVHLIFLWDYSPQVPVTTRFQQYSAF